MWFIKNEFWDEFQKLLNEYSSESEIIRNIKTIKMLEDFCKKGKGVSFYSIRTLNNKVMKEIEKYLNDESYHQYTIKEI